MKTDMKIVLFVDETRATLNVPTDEGRLGPGRQMAINVTIVSVVSRVGKTT